MSRSKPKVRRKRYALLNPISMAIEGSQSISEKKLNSLRLMELTSIESFANGRAVELDYCNVKAMCSLCEALAEGDIGREALDACGLLSASLQSILASNGETGAWAVEKEELQAMRDVYEYLDLQRQSVDMRTFEQYIQIASNKAMRKDH